MNDDQIRQEAERRFRAGMFSPQTDAPAATRIDPDDRIEALRIHQIELEIRNEELRCAQEELEESRRRYRRLYELAPAGYLIVGPDGRILSANQAISDMAGTDHATLTRAGLFGFIHNACHRAVVDLLRDVAAAPGRRVAIVVSMAGETERYLHIDAVCTDEAHTPGQEVHVCLTDVTSEKLAESSAQAAAEESRMLLRELNHRVKNNLQLLLSLIMLQKSRTEDPAAHAALVAAEARVRTVTFAHQSLNAGSADLGAELVGLLDPLVRQYSEQHGVRIEFTSSVDQLFVDGNAALSLALAVNELVASTAGHAVTAGAHGLITVRLQVDPQAPAEGTAVRISVRGSEPDLPADLPPDCTLATEASSDLDELGLLLVDQLVRQQLGGRWTRRDDPAGGAEHCIEVVL
jgi:two-component sensor histidine kinase/PAS domain-containing protein